MDGYSMSHLHLDSRAGLILNHDVQIKPLAAESIGVRSLAVFVTTPDVKILIDPGAALGFRDRYHPHPQEYQRLAEARRHILTHAQQSDVVVLSHFHRDHFMPLYVNFAYFWSNRRDGEQLYGNRKVWCKDIRENINPAQQQRGYNLVRGLRKIVKEINYADGRAHKLGKTLIRFSPAVPHGELETRLGWVIMTAIRYQEITVVHASDVQGPMLSDTTDWILQQKPHLVILAGPPTYLSPSRVSPATLEKAKEQMIRLANQIPILVMDHHLMRDSQWRQWVKPVITVGEDQGNQVSSVADLLKAKEDLLEAHRQELYTNHPPSQAYESWVKQIKDGRITIPPPLDD
jgi:predicted metallo-beta-lactamase superfamily hydrolase